MPASDERPWHGRLRRLALGAAALLVCLAACSRKPALPPPDQVYTLRGQIAALPEPGKPASDLVIHHEPIPGFVNRDGVAVGMDSMEMPFPPAPGVSLKGLSQGDVVEFTFEVRWKQAPFSQLTRITKLPPDTALNFGKAR